MAQSVIDHATIDWQTLRRLPDQDFVSTLAAKVHTHCNIHLATFSLIFLPGIVIRSAYFYRLSRPTYSREKHSDSTNALSSSPDVKMNLSQQQKRLTFAKKDSKCEIWFSLSFFHFLCLFCCWFSLFLFTPCHGRQWLCCESYYFLVTKAHALDIATHAELICKLRAPQNRLVACLAQTHTTRNISLQAELWRHKQHHHHRQWGVEECSLFFFSTWLLVISKNSRRSFLVLSCS